MNTMKKVRKAILLALCAVLLVGASVAGTLAYLTSQTKTLTNTFTVGKVEITLTEAKTDAYGRKLNKNGDLLQTAGGEEQRISTGGNKYTLIPGQTYHKDPTLTLKKGSEDCIVFVKVKEPSETAKSIIKYTLNFDADHQWYPLTDVEGLESGETLYYRRCSALESDNYDFYLLGNPTENGGNTAFNNGGFTIASDVTAERLNDLTQNGNTIGNLEFTAYAIQDMGFEDDDDLSRAWGAVSKLDTTTP